MSRRKQTNPRAIKRDVSQDDDDENSELITKKFATESIRSNSIDSTVTTEDEQQNSSIKCDNCQEIFLTSEQFNHHRLYQCSFLPDETNSDESRTSSYDEYANQTETIPHGISQNEEYPHPCAYCHKAFSNMALLLKHEQVHVELMPFRCSFCGKGFKHRRSLNRHSKLHTGERKFKCTLCESTFARSDHLKAHIRTHSNSINNNNNNSITLDKSINLDFQLKIPTHTKPLYEERPISSSNNKINKDENKTEHCPYCPRICLGDDSLRYHIQNEHNQSVEDDSNNDHFKSERISPSSNDTYCHLCNAKFNNRENYYAHIRCTHPPFQKTLDQISLFQIPSITKQPDKNDDLILNEYALIEKTIWCDKCKRSFDSMTVYLQHYSFQHCLQIIKCLQCQDVFETIDLFFSHIEQTHPSKTIETYKCKLCNASYKHCTDFLHHIQTVHKSTLYSCSLCSCQLNSTNELIDHLKFIHKINQNIDFHINHRRPSFNTLFPCTYCSLKFNSRFDLNQHILHEHNDERRHIISDWHQNGKKLSTPSSSDIMCTLCDLSFPSESLLLEHNKQTHRSPPPPSLSPSFKCTCCHALFTSRTQLDRHSRIHIASSGTNLKCNICDRLFSTIDILSEHKLSHCKATTSNICLHCHQLLNNEADFTRHLHEHNHHHHHLKSKARLYSNNNDSQFAITCIICKQSLLNEHEIDLHAKFHLANIKNKETSLIPMTITCNQCHQTTNTNREYLLELPSFNINCFNCIEKDLKSPDPCTKPEIESISNSLTCLYCRNDAQFDSIKTYQQHFTSIHLSKNSTEEYHCLKCNKIVPFREHIFQHQYKKSSSSLSGFLIDSIDSSISSRCPSPPRVHYCYLCRTNFDTAIKMHIHLIEHQYPNHDYQCSLCEQCSFDDASQLYHHMVQHGSKARLHPCRECDVYFMFSMHLINHQYSHTDETLGKKSNGLKYSLKSKMISNEDNKQLLNEDDDNNSCKSIVTRSSTKGTCRSVFAS
ncbi:unnamed protein product [Adineta steineri]|uniref:C2H2-type domain-containing protein n=1 Tax=Adineta steineri TaxID=433720 RepID=A0A814QET6_9BILA|nr:unnamed protein product [Adineta steineri]CAF1426530.1 unnamed protein product [Adineta steineri]